MPIKVPHLQTMKYRWIVLWSGLILLSMAVFYGLGSGWIQLTYETFRCGHQPVVGTHFLTNTYVLPSDTGYEPAGLFGIYFCSEAEAKAAGYHADITSSANNQETTDTAAANEATEEQRLKSSRNYTVYLPNTPGYSYTNYSVTDIRGAVQTFYDLKKDGTIVAEVRQGPIGNEYEICQSEACDVAGKDSQGREVRVDGSMPRSAAAIRIGNTFVTFTGIDEDFTIDEAITVFGSLKEEQ